MHGAAEAARKKAARAILAMANAHFPEHHIDADEAPDEVTRLGYSAATHNLVPVEPDACLGYACPLKSDACDRCEIDKRADEHLEDFEFSSSLNPI